MEDKNKDFTRLNLTLPKSLHTHLNEQIPHGLRNNIYVSLISKAADLLDEKGAVGVMALLRGEFRIELIDQ